MLLVLNISVEIAGLKFKRVHDLHIESSAANISTTATIRIPRTARITRQGRFVTEVETAKEFPSGSEVVIRMGYDGELREEFRGYVKSVTSGAPVAIECEDATYLLRKKRVHKSWRHATLRDILDEIVRDTPVRYMEPLPNIVFSPFYIHHSNAASALQKLRDNLGLVIRMMPDRRLYVAFAEQSDNRRTTLRITDNVISDKLEWVDERDVTLKAKAVSILRNNKRIEVEVGDLDGDQRTLYFYNITSAAELKEIAARELRKYKYTGVRGDLTTFLQPVVEVGQTVLIRDPIYPERNGDYLVDKVVTSFGTGGGRRVVYPGLKVNI